jgi:ABC-type transporter Mla subunit MlaD
MSPLVSLIADAVVTGLMVATIIFVWRLNGRLKLVRQQREELAETIAAFTAATAQAEAGFAQLRANAQQTSDALRITIGEAATLRDELVLMIETAESVAKRLEQGSAAASSTLRRQQEAQDGSLYAAVVPPVTPPVTPPPAPARPAPAMEVPRAAEPLRADPGLAATGGAKPRSKSEQDLLNAIERLK